jgi:hypothetical protein
MVALQYNGANLRRGPLAAALATKTRTKSHGNIHDQFFGDPTVTPNPNLGPIDRAPYYAVPINNGDLGTRAD